MTLVSYYELLGVSEDSEPLEIRKAYRTAMVKNHPDLNRGETNYTTRSRELNLAFETLIDPTRKEKYDEELAKKRQDRRYSVEQTQEPPDAESAPSALSKYRWAIVPWTAALALIACWALFLWIDPFRLFSPDHTDNSGLAKRPKVWLESSTPSDAQNAKLSDKVEIGASNNQDSLALLNDEKSFTRDGRVFGNASDLKTVDPWISDEEDSKSIATSAAEDPFSSLVEEEYFARDDRNSGDVSLPTKNRSGATPKKTSTLNPVGDNTLIPSNGVSDNLSSGKNRIPNLKEQQAARARIKAVYGNRYRFAIPKTQKKSLAEELFEVGVETNDDFAAKYMLIAIALDIAIQAVDAKLARNIIRYQCSAFEIDEFALLSESYGKFNATIGDRDFLAREEFLQALLNDVFRLRIFDQLSESLFICEIGIQASQPSTEPSTDDFVQLRSYILWQREQRSKLKRLSVIDELSQVEIVDASFENGKYRCFATGDWDSGLPALAQGKDQDLAEIVRLELQNAPTTKLEIATNWWDYAMTRSASEFEKLNLMLHAGEWLRKAKSDLRGLDRMAVDQKLAMVAEIRDKSGLLVKAIEFKY